MRVVFLDLEGPTLTPEELDLIQHAALAGIIFFARNYEHPQQFMDLVASIRESAPDLVFAVDHEGGRVQRFQVGMSRLPSMRHFGKLYEQDIAMAQTSLLQQMRQAGLELKRLGIDINLMPVLDVEHAHHSVASGRSFSQNPAVVTALAELAIDTLHAAGLSVVVKHFPGHGGVVLDSHDGLPVDNRDKSMIADDYVPFKNLVTQYDMLMPAHVIYSAYDQKPASFSSYWLKTVLRDQWGFQGVAISDDLSMRSATSMGNPVSCAYAALNAGCDLILICNQRKNAITVLQSLVTYHDSDSLVRINRLMQHIYQHRKNL